MTSSTDQLATSMADLTVGIKLTDSTPRPEAGGGTVGKTIRVIANAFLVTQFSGKPQALRYHYDVTMAMVEEVVSGQYRPVVRQGSEKPLPAAMQQRLLNEAFDLAFKRGEAGITRQHLGSLAYDGKKNIFTPTKFGFEEHTIYLDVPSRREGGTKRFFQITLKLVNEIDPSIIDLFCRGDRQTIQAASSSTADGLSLALQSGEIALRTGPSSDPNLKLHGAGGRKFFALSPTIPISNGGEIAKGFFQSLRATKYGLCLNLDVAFTCFVAPGKLIEVVTNVLGLGSGGGGGAGGRGGGRGGRGGGNYGGGRGGGIGGGGGRGAALTKMSPSEVQSVRKILSGVMIKVTHRDGAKAEKLTGFSPKPARATEFTLPDGTVTTIGDYFRAKYNKVMQFPDLPCVVLSRNTMVPMEFCEVLPGTGLGPLKMKPAMVQDMIRESALKPDIRLARTKELRRQNAYEGSKLLQSFDMNIAMEPVEINARVLPSPKVAYGNKEIFPRDASWNLAGNRFVASGDVLKTVVLINCVQRSESEVRKFAESQLRQCDMLGMNIRVQKMHYAQCAPDPNRIKDAMTEAGRAAYALGGKVQPPQLYFVFMDGTNQPLYDAVKRAGALELATPVATQCINIMKGFARDERKQAQYCSNVAMKINAKLGGTNHTVKSLPKIGNDCMLIGADVTHPAPGSVMPSIVASVATTDGQRNRYNSVLEAQYNEDRTKKAQETILKGEDIYLRHFKAWKSKNGDKLPSTIVVFRDGVSEGEYQKVVDREVDQLKSAGKKIKPGYNPKITFIVCGKRHHMRFYAKNQVDCDRSGNLPAGTVIDTGVVHPYAFDFYLQSQAGLVGTARPAHYVVVKDEIGFNSNDLQTLLNNLSYTYARATRAVSLPPMVMYAHFLAEKGRGLIYGAEGGFSDTASSMSGGRGVRDDASPDVQIIAQQLSREAFQNGTQFGQTLWYM